jgi:hypothetical protein
MRRRGVLQRHEKGRQMPLFARVQRGQFLFQQLNAHTLILFPILWGIKPKAQLLAEKYKEIIIQKWHEFFN